MTCNRCRTVNRGGRRFCAKCGAALAATCAACGFTNDPGDDFCGGCGQTLAATPAVDGGATPTTGAAPETAAIAPTTAAPPSQPPRPLVAYTPKHLVDKILGSRSALEGERRQVTVLFADIAGFTTLAERLDPEDVHRIINRCFELITVEVHRFEGTINQYTGDGVMALFGAPIAHEDAPRRAAHAALGIQRAVRDYSHELQSPPGLTLQMRIGLNTGPVVVGRIGDDLRMDYTAVGDTTNLAARMQQSARPGSVLVTEATRRLITRFFETLDLGAVAVKGHAPVAAFELLRARRQRLSTELSEPAVTPFVGRHGQVASLLDRFAEAKAGRGQVVFVAGEAGIGKSRLLLEFRRVLEETPETVTWLEGQSVSFGQSIPFLPLVDQLRKNFAIEEFDGEPEIIAKIEHGMRRMGELEPHIPFIRYLLSVDPGDAAVSVIEAAVRRRRVFDAVRALTLREASRRPLVLVFEDLHWIDSSSVEYITALMDSVAGFPLLVILTYRVGYTPPFGTRSFHSTIALTSLSRDESVALAGGMLKSDHIPDELAAALLEKAEGVPLFIEEVTKTLLDLGILHRDNGSLRMVRSMDAVSIPDTINGIIMARLDRLGEDGKRTVQLASVIGRQFLARLLSRVAGMTNRLDALLHELTSLEIIYEKALLPEPTYIFKHAVIQDVAYNSLLRERRKELHRVVGDAMEELYVDRLADHHEELAHHFVNGEVWEKAFDYLTRSGDRAKGAYANQVALDFYARAIDAASRVSPPVEPRRLMRVYQQRGQVWILLSRYPEAIAEFERQLEIARAAGDGAGEGEALVQLALGHWLTFSTEHVPDAERYATAAREVATRTGDPHTLALSLSYLGLIDQVRGKLDDGERKYEESLRIAEPRGLKDVILQDQIWLGAHANWRGDFRKALAFTRQAEMTAREIHEGFQELFALAFQCLAHIGLGRYGEALAVIHDGLTKARERNNAFMEGRLTNTLGWFYQELGDFGRAHQYNRTGVELGQRAKNPNVEISSLINLGLDHLSFGEPATALSLLEETLVRVEKYAFGAHRWRWSNHLSVYVAEVLLEQGRSEEAWKYAELALGQARATGSLKYIGKALALQGAIALRAERWADAENALVDSLRVAQDIGYPTLLWQTAHALSLAQAGQAKIDEAVGSATLALGTLASVESAIPEPDVRRTFLEWGRVRAVQEHRDRLRRR